MCEHLESHLQAPTASQIGLVARVGGVSCAGLGVARFLVVEIASFHVREVLCSRRGIARFYVGEVLPCAGAEQQHRGGRSHAAHAVLGQLLRAGRCHPAQAAQFLDLLLRVRERHPRVVVEVPQVRGRLVHPAADHSYFCLQDIHAEVGREYQCQDMEHCAITISHHLGRDLHALLHFQGLCHGGRYPSDDVLLCWEDEALVGNHGNDGGSAGPMGMCLDEHARKQGRSKALLAEDHNENCFALLGTAEALRPERHLGEFPGLPLDELR
mmetsp:Transcript_9704/g.27145  ORF Transcript_9704/g.27145 Transcript_9704/m.27145 type:complete len:269 (-) Transcript_9704:87-893(-)